MFEKVEDQRGVELLDVQLRWRCSRAFGGKGKQQPEGVGVSLAGMRAVAALPGHVIAQEDGDQRSEAAHQAPPTKVSAAAAIADINSGIACRYQYVYLRSECPM